MPLTATDCLALAVIAVAMIPIAAIAVMAIRSTETNR